MKNFKGYFSWPSTRSTQFTAKRRAGTMLTCLCYGEVKGWFWRVNEPQINVQGHQNDQPSEQERNLTDNTASVKITATTMLKPTKITSRPHYLPQTWPYGRHQAQTKGERGSLSATGVLNRPCSIREVRKGEELTYFWSGCSLQPLAWVSLLH